MAEEVTIVNEEICRLTDLLGPLHTAWRKSARSGLPKRNWMYGGHMGAWRCSSTILNLSTRWRLVVSFTALLRHPWEISPQSHWICTINVIYTVYCFWRQSPVSKAPFLNNNNNNNNIKI
jgi:hypothetical protein